MKVIPMLRLPLSALLLLLTATSFLHAADGPAITVVKDPSAGPLESYAANELSGLLKTLFDAKVTEAKGNPPTGATNVIRLGAAPSKDFLPADLGKQGHIVKSTPSGLVIAGGSPVATLWAVYEFGYANGMRYLTSGDFPPKEKPAFTLDGYDIVRKPLQTIRAWHIRTHGPASQ
ncbi:MAG: hypothetical protein KDL87_04000, partial [Verrucomicrobiae bacterium]|nr:hypothetical protein [Verrucomicrobiae bacterium]